MPEELRRVLYFGDVECHDPPELVDRQMVKHWLKISGLPFTACERLEREFVDWLTRCDDAVPSDILHRLHDQERGLVEARRVAYEALIYIPASSMEMLAEKIAIAAEIDLDGFTLKAIGEDARRLADGAEMVPSSLRMASAASTRNRLRC